MPISRSGLSGQEPRPALCSAGELFGGVERHMVGLCTYLMRREVEPLLVLFHDRELAAQVRALGLEPEILESSGSYDLRTPSRLAALLARRRINVVHAHGYRAVVNCALAHRHHRFRLVRTVHGKVEPRAGNPLVWLKERCYRWLESTSSRRRRAHVCYVTEDLARHHAACGHDPLSRVIYNGIDPLDRDGLVRPPELDAGSTNLLVVGRISAVKGIEFALRALVEPSVPGTVVLNVLGTGEQRAVLEQQARDLGIADRVRFLGFKRNVLEYLAYGDGLLMPSLHEGLPYVLLEAMALGLPLLASRVAGLAEVLQNGDTALLFPVGDVPAIGQAIGSLVSDTALRRRLGDLARQEQRERFTLDRMGRQYWQTYRAALAGDANWSEAKDGA